jgi:catechol 2,3-dioxygenase-like lactoylglutathione lyase family enzyme
MKSSPKLDHIIVNVNDVEETLSFWKEILGFESEETSGPFTVLRISEELTFQLAPWGTEGGSHFAFSLDNVEFEKTFEKLKNQNIPYGDSFHNVGTQQGPGNEAGAKGLGKTIYFFDPNKHLLEIRTYENEKQR